ncbi:hypothetical protein FOCC_FOCC007171 [Frankliniella occidentalis]|nr:hypothetical protein FOCC_FOCC007171 [Frankliniella occidentalis]
MCLASEGLGAQDDAVGRAGHGAPRAAAVEVRRLGALAGKPSVEIRDDLQDDDDDDVDDEDNDDGDGDHGGGQFQDGSGPGPPEDTASGEGGCKGLMIVTVISVQYVKIVVLMGLALPVCGVLTFDTPQSFEAFYLYLYLVSLLFMMYLYIVSAWRHRSKVTVKRKRGNRGMRYRLKLLKQTRAVETVRYGSVYLRLAMSDL